nr:avidin/streptavidin family protein [Ruegeria arenilitoris]
MRIRGVVTEKTGTPDDTEHFRITGTYQTAKGSIPFNVKSPLSGYVTLDQITFSVSFRYFAGDRDIHSLTAWAGQILPNPDNPARESLQTLWNLVPNLADGEHEDQYGWVIAWSGTDRFTRLSSDPDHIVVEPS